MDILRLHMFGVSEVERAGVIYTVPRVKPLALLAYLAIEEGMHPRERLATLLWPEMDEHNARSNLRTTLAIVRRTLGVSEGTPSIWRVVSDAVGIDPMVVLADTQTVATAAALARQREVPSGLAPQLADAIAVYRGPFLDGLGPDISPDYDAWLLHQRETYHRHIAAILTRLADLQEAQGELAAAAETLERLVDHDSLDDTPYRRLMAVYLALGDRAAGRRVYEAYRAMHAATWDGEPDLQIVALAERLCQASRTAPLISGRSLGGAVMPPLVGRAGDMATLRARYADADAGTAQIVVVAGEAGMGKTRLVTEFARWAAARGADVLEGRAFEPADALPYGALVEALRPRMERENAPDDVLGDLWLAELTRLLPELVERYPDLLAVAANRPEGAAHLYEAVVRLLRAWAQRHTVVLCLDDMQWADEALRNLLLYAARRWTVAGTRLLVLLAVQADGPTAAAVGLATWLARFGREATTTRLDLGALPEGATIDLVSLLAGTSSSTLSEVPEESSVAQLGLWLHGASGGLPLLMVELLHGLLDAGLLGFRVTAEGWVLDLKGRGVARDWQLDMLPTRLRDALITRLARVAPLDRDLLLIGTVWGSEFTLERLCCLADLPEEVVADALDRLVQAHLLCEVGSTGRYTFPHEMLRTLTYAQVGAARRRLLHRRALTVLEAEGAPAAEMARHAVAVGSRTYGITPSPLADGAAVMADAERQELTPDDVKCWAPVFEPTAARMGRSGLHQNQAGEQMDDHVQLPPVYGALLTSA